jgi:hypothetical protein
MTTSKVTFPADGIYELDQKVTYPSIATTVNFVVYAKSSGSCEITMGCGIQGGAIFGQRTFGLSSTYQSYSLACQTDGETNNGYIAVVTQCSSGPSSVSLDGLSLD